MPVSTSDARHFEINTNVLEILTSKTIFSECSHTVQTWLLSYTVWLWEGRQHYLRQRNCKSNISGSHSVCHFLQLPQITECACGTAPHFTATLPFRHLWDIHPGVPLRPLSWFIVVLTDKRAVRLSVRGVIMTVGLAADGIAVIVCLQWHTEWERRRGSWRVMIETHCLPEWRGEKRRRADKQKDVWDDSGEQQNSSYSKV